MYISKKDFCERVRPEYTNLEPRTWFKFARNFTGFLQI
jgi:hypothetical protein